MRFETFTPAQERDTFHGIHRELLRNAHSKAEGILKKEAVDPTLFSDIYSSDEIESDLKRTKELSGIFAKSNKESVMLHEASSAAEALILEQIRNSDWLSADGVEVFVEKTSATDDYINKTDLVLTFETRDLEEPLAITVDVTIGVQALSEKIHSIKREIDMRTLAKVKYHESLLGKHEALEQTPRVLIGIDPAELKRLFTLWTSTDESIRDRLKEHPLQRTITHEIEMQLRAYSEYATARGDSELAKNYEGILSIIKKVRESKDKEFSGETDIDDRYLSMLGTALKSQLVIIGAKA